MRSFKKVFILLICILVLSSTAALANSIDDEILEKQKEIDKYLFEDHIEEIEAQGFTVTHTGPFEDYVEIGITPYTEENANYLYEIFGSEMVKVVEGEQAEILIMDTQANDTEEIAESGSDSSVLMYTVGGVILLGGIFIIIRKLKVEK